MFLNSINLSELFALSDIIETQYLSINMCVHKSKEMSNIIYKFIGTTFFYWLVSLLLLKILFSSGFINYLT